jgi:PAS domain S-box-containing protein
VKVRRPITGKSAVKPKAGVPGKPEPRGGLRRDESNDRTKFATLFKSMRQGVFYQAADGSLIDINPAALKMFGVTRREFLSRNSLHPAWHVVREDGTPIPGPEHPSMIALRTGKPVKDLVVGVTHARSEETVWLSANAIPEFRPGETKPYRVAVTLHDLTAVKQAEEALRESHDRFQSLFRNIREAVAIYEAVDGGKDFVIRDFNPAAEAIEHVRRESLIGRKVTEAFPGVRPS